MAKTQHAFHIKRIYEAPGATDGLRVLVDRLWPRGISKEKAAVDLWLKEVTPSSDLRKWYHADLSRWEEFRQRYVAELEAAPEAVKTLRDAARAGPVTLLTATRDEAQNHALVLRDFLRRKP